MTFMFLQYDIRQQSRSYPVRPIIYVCFSTVDGDKIIDFNCPLFSPYLENINVVFYHFSHMDYYRRI